MTSCASVNERIHSVSSNCFEVGSIFRNISCVLSRKRHSSGKSPVAHLIVRMSRHRNRRLLWPAPARATMASKCSCLTPVGPGALIGDSLTWGNEGTCFAPSLLPHRAPRQFVAPSTPGDSGRIGTLRTGGMSSNARAPRNESCGPVPAAVRWTLRSQADQSLHGFADGASGRQGAGSLPDLFVCLRLHPSCCSAGRPRILLTQDLANQNADLSPIPATEAAVSVRSSCRHLSGSQPGASDSGSDTALPRTGDRSRLL